MLDTVRVAAERSRVGRNEGKQPDISGTEQAATNAAVAANQQGDLNAIAATIPGVTPVTGADGDPAGFSVLGLSSDQNNTTLNGNPFGSSNIPRDANVTTSVVTTPYDVSRGGFSGAQFSIRTGPGSNFIRRSTSLNFDAPRLQWTDPSARALGQQYTNLSRRRRARRPDRDGQGVLQRLVSARPPQQRSLLAAQHQPSRPPVRGHLGRFRGATDRPARPGAGADARERTCPEQSPERQRVAVRQSLDFIHPTRSTAQTFNVTFNGNWSRQTPASSLTSEFPAHSGDRTNWNAGVTGTHTAYVKSLLSESSLGFNGSQQYGSPYSNLPSASVLVNSDLP